MKKIFIHALGAEIGGAIRHLTNFLPELSRQDQVNQYFVLLRESFSNEILLNNINIKKAMIIHIPNRKIPYTISSLLPPVGGINVGIILSPFETVLIAQHPRPLRAL